MKIIAIHQPNFVPWFPYFEKMNLADTFVVLYGCQFEKNGYQNRFQYKDKWITNPVEKGNVEIIKKHYTNGQGVVNLNLKWINVLKDTFDIKTEINYETKTKYTGTERLVHQIKAYEGTHYLTNPEAFDKYLDKDLFDKFNIEIIEHKPQYKKSSFEMLEEHGIEGCRKILKRQKSVRVA